MARVGVVMLVHEHLHRVAALVNHWCAQGCPVSIHADRRVPAAAMSGLHSALKKPDLVRFAARHACEWGTFPIVAATNAAAGQLMADFPDITHVLLSSGACVPLQPAEALSAFLDDHPDTDFIQSVACEDVDWAMGGLNEERFTLRFPFAWKRNRRLFDDYVALQRRIGMSRGIPEAVAPHLGSQWWCLTRQTLSAILNAPERRRIDRYFRRVWIPDESYYQSLARRHTRNLVSRSLTFSRFDSQGRPFVLYDDHLPRLRGRPDFLARKVWNGANAIFDAFLDDKPLAQPNSPAEPLERLFDAAEARRRHGRPGLFAQHRFPRAGFERGKTRGRYTVLMGFDSAFAGLQNWMAEATGQEVHGRLFHPQGAQFSDGQPNGPGGLSSIARLRDYNPFGFLDNLMWAAEGRHQVILFEAGDARESMGFVASDPNAGLSIISGAWLLPLLSAGLPFERLRKTAARLHKEEARILRMLDDPWKRTAARIEVLPLRRFLIDPSRILDTVLARLPAKPDTGQCGLPVLRSSDGLDEAIERLRNSGIEVPSVGMPEPMAIARGAALVGGTDGAPL